MRVQIGAGALYLCYFGLREPLVQTQVLPYLRELAGGGYRMSLLTFEPELGRRWTPEATAQWQERLSEEGIHWYRLPYHRRPSLPATLLDVAAGAWLAARIARREGLAILHGRSHVATAMGALARRLGGGRLVFDLRGVLAEEYVDAGNWPAGGLLYRLTKRAERWLLRTADGCVVLTERGKESLPPTAATRGRPVEVIPCCVDPQRFAAARDDRDAVRATLGLQGRLVLVHAGRLGGPYLVAELAELLATARGVEPRVFALLLTQGDARPIAAALGRAGFAPQDYRVLAVPPEEVPRHLLAADVGLCVLRPSPACRFSSPTKVAEYLAAGLPLIATAGVGDLDAQLEVGGLGALLPQLDEPAYLAAFRTVERLRADPGLGDRCRAAARRHYDLHTVGGERYRRLYAAVLRLEAGR